MTITVEQVIATLEEVVAEKGEDYVYPQTERNHVGDCRYSTGTGMPSCIVGHVVARLDAESFSEFTKYENREENSFSINHAFAEENQGVPQLQWARECENILFLAQNAQDDGGTWGFALTAAKAAL